MWMSEVEVEVSGLARVWLLPARDSPKGRARLVSQYQL